MDFVRVALYFILAALLTSCGSPQLPTGNRTPNIDKLVANNWLSQDTLISINVNTFEEDIQTTISDLSPDTLASGLIVYQIAEYMPVFAGCETDEDPAICTQRSLNEFVIKHLDYPRWAKVRGFEGSATATFLIDSEGRVRDTGIDLSMGDEFDRLVLELVDKLPTWHPGFHNGEPVAVRYRLPVSFTLRD